MRLTPQGPSSLPLYYHAEKEEVGGRGSVWVQADAASIRHDIQDMNVGQYGMER